MSRVPRMVLPGIPHHVTQRGNRRERTFFEVGDYALYRDRLGDLADFEAAALSNRRTQAIEHSVNMFSRIPVGLFRKNLDETASVGWQQRSG